MACLALARTDAAQAEGDSPYLQRENPLRSLLPTPEARAEREQAALAQKLERLLASQPGVERADMVLTAPVAALVPLAQAVPPARATLVVRMKDERADLRGVTELARRVLPEGTELRVTRQTEVAGGAGPEAARRPGTPPAAAAVRRVGPFQVEEPSVGALRATLAGLLASNALLAGLLLWRRARRPE